MKVMLTGGNGYIGSNLLRKLISLNYQVDLVIRPQSNLSTISDVINNCGVYKFKGESIEMVKIFEDSKPEIVVHLAAQSSYNNNYSNVKSLIESNILFGSQILEAMSSVSVEYFINTGSYWQHNNSLVYHPNSLYAATKESFQNIMYFYEISNNIKSITLKLFDTYGPNDSRKKIIPSLIRAMKTKEKVILSPANQFLDIVYISDVVNAYIIAMETLFSNKNIGKNDKYFISSNEHIRLKQFIEKFINVMGCNIEIEWGGRPYRAREIMVPLINAPTLPNWETEINIDKGFQLIKESLNK